MYSSQPSVKFIQHSNFDSSRLNEDSKWHGQGRSLHEDVKYSSRKINL